MGADFLKFSNVIFSAFIGRLHGPQIGNFILADVKHSCTVWGAQPFVQAGGIILAVKVSDIKIKVSKCVGPIYDNWDTVLSCHADDFFYGQNLACKIDHVAHEDNFCICRNILFEETNDFIFILSRYGDFELFHNNTVPAFPLFESINHSAVVLGGGEDFVTRFQINSVLTNLKSLRGVSCQGNFFRITFKKSGHSPANRFTLGFKDAPHGISG